MHEPTGNDDSSYEDLYTARFVKDDEPEEESIGNVPPYEPTPLDLAAGTDSASYEFVARTRTHDKIRFSRVEQVCGRLILRDGVVQGVDSDSRTFFDMLETELDALVWITSTRRKETNRGK